MVLRATKKYMQQGNDPVSETNILETVDFSKIHCQDLKKNKNVYFNKRIDWEHIKEQK